MATNLYLIKLSNDNEEFYKIGVSVHKYCRFYQIMKFGYRAKIIYMVMKLDELFAYDLESYLHYRFDDVRYIPQIKFGGYRECYKGINIENYKNEVTNKLDRAYNLIEDLEIKWH